MTILFPEGVKSLGNTSIVVAPTIVDPQAPKVAEVSSGTGVVNASCYFYNVPAATTTAARAEKPRRACEIKARQGFGIETTEIESLSYTYDPQGAVGDPANKVKEALAPYTEAWIVMRDGLPAEAENLKAGDKVNLHRVELGPQNRTRTGDDDQAEFSITQDVTVQESHYDVEIVT